MQEPVQYWRKHQFEFNPDLLLRFIEILYMRGEEKQYICQSSS